MRLRRDGGGFAVLGAGWNVHRAVGISEVGGKSRNCPRSGGHFCEWYWLVPILEKAHEWALDKKVHEDADCRAKDHVKEDGEIKIGRAHV